MTANEFDELRPSAFAIAYRMLGSVSEAEDMVQEGSSASTERATAASRWKPAAGLSLSLSMRSSSAHLRTRTAALRDLQKRRRGTRRLLVVRSGSERGLDGNASFRGSDTLAAVAGGSSLGRATLWMGSCGSQPDCLRQVRRVACPFGNPLANFMSASGGARCRPPSGR